jgi:hypothetical protein
VSASTTALDLSDTAAGKLKAQITTVCSSNGLTITQVVTMNEDDQYFTNTVNIQNTGVTALSDVRFTFWVDPDNTKDMDGDYTTKNTVVQVAFYLYTQHFCCPLSCAIILLISDFCRRGFCDGPSFGKSKWRSLLFVGGDHGKIDTLFQ